MARNSSSFRVRRVQGYLRGQVWYLCYRDHGKRHCPRVDPDPEAARQLAAQINAQLEVGAPAAMSFEPIATPELRVGWLNHHELMLRSSVQTINRYRTATEQLLRFVATVRPVRYASQFGNHHADESVQHLRTIQVAANGHKNTPKRPLMDKGIRYILETCRALFNYAGKSTASALAWCGGRCVSVPAPSSALAWGPLLGLAGTRPGQGLGLPGVSRCPCLGLRRLSRWSRPSLPLPGCFPTGLRPGHGRPLRSLLWDTISNAHRLHSARPSSARALPQEADRPFVLLRALPARWLSSCQG